MQVGPLDYFIGRLPDAPFCFSGCGLLLRSPPPPLQYSQQELRGSPWASVAVVSSTSAQPSFTDFSARWIRLYFWTLWWDGVVSGHLTQRIFCGLRAPPGALSKK
eukprot:RCo022423